MAFGQFEFGLTAQEEERASKLHSEAVIVDSLFQGPCGSDSFTDAMEKELDADWEAHHDPARDIAMGFMVPCRYAAMGQFPAFKECWDASGITAGNRQVEIHTFEVFSTLFGVAALQFDRMPWLVKATKAEHFREAKKGGLHAGFISTQLAFGPPPSLEIVDGAYDLGLRMLQLTYNTMTPIASGCTERTDAGVSNFGAKLIARMNELGIIVDTSHCGKQTTLDACSLSTTPVIASHSSAQAVYMHDRGKSDEEIRAIAGTGGLVGVVAVPFFMGSGKQLTIEVMLDHIDYIAKLVGPQHVGIGSDWPNQLPHRTMKQTFTMFTGGAGFRSEHNIDTAMVLDGFGDYRDFPNITRGLVKRGYSDNEIKGILGENFLRVFEQVCG